MSDFPLPDADDEDDDDGAHGIPVPSGTWPAVKSRWTGNHNMSASRWGSRVAGAAGSGANVAVGGISHAGMVGLGGAAAAIGLGTGGVAIVAATGVAQLGSMVASARSASKTWDHMKALAAIRAGGPYRCTALPGGAGGGKDHDHIHHSVIPYIINKKTAKLVKKGVGTVGLGIGTTLFGMGKSLYKRARGTLGRRRTFYAHVVARHMITHDCALCDALVSELFSHGDYLRLRTMDSKDAEGWLARKMQST